MISGILGQFGISANNEAVRMGIQSSYRAGALDEGNRTSVAAFDSRAFDEKDCDDSVDHQKHGREQLRVVLRQLHSVKHAVLSRRSHYHAWQVG